MAVIVDYVAADGINGSSGLPGILRYLIDLSSIYHLNPDEAIYKKGKNC
jgi:hypothetical protein